MSYSNGWGAPGGRLAALAQGLTNSGMRLLAPSGPMPGPVAIPAVEYRDPPWVRRVPFQPGPADPFGSPFGRRAPDSLSLLVDASATATPSATDSAPPSMAPAGGGPGADAGPAPGITRSYPEDHHALVDLYQQLNQKLSGGQEDNGPHPVDELTRGWNYQRGMYALGQSVLDRNMANLPSVTGQVTENTPRVNTWGDVHSAGDAVDWGAAKAGEVAAEQWPMAPLYLGALLSRDPVTKPVAWIGRRVVSGMEQKREKAAQAFLKFKAQGQSDEEAMNNARRTSLFPL